MSKAVLIIDMPENCMKCPLRNQVDTFVHQGYCCSYNGKKK